jgi:hypothetical protein
MIIYNGISAILNSLHFSISLPLTVANMPSFSLVAPDPEYPAPSKPPIYLPLLVTVDFFYGRYRIKEDRGLDIQACDRFANSAGSQLLERKKGGLRNFQYATTWEDNSVKPYVIYPWSWRRIGHSHRLEHGHADTLGHALAHAQNSRNYWTLFEPK